MTAEPLMDKGSAFLCFVLTKNLTKIIFGKLSCYVSNRGGIWSCYIIRGHSSYNSYVLATAFGYILEVMSI